MQLISCMAMEELSQWLAFGWMLISTNPFEASQPLEVGFTKKDEVQARPEGLSSNDCHRSSLVCCSQAAASPHLAKGSARCHHVATEAFPAAKIGRCDKM